MVSHFVKLVCKAEKSYTLGLIVAENSRKKTPFFFSKAPLIHLSTLVKKAKANRLDCLISAWAGRNVVSKGV